LNKKQEEEKKQAIL